jgi:hypothetical protein
MTADTVAHLRVKKTEIDDLSPTLETRAKLNISIKELRKQCLRAFDSDDMPQYNLLQAQINKLEKQAKRLPLLHELEEECYLVKQRIAEALHQEDSNLVAELHNRQKRLEHQISAEKETEKEAHDGEDSNCLHVRSELVSMMEKRQKTFHELTAQNRYEEADPIRTEFFDLKRLVERMPSERNLRRNIAQLKSEQAQANAEMKNHVAKAIHEHLCSKQDQLTREIRGGKNSEALRPSMFELSLSIVLLKAQYKSACAKRNYTDAGAIKGKYNYLIKLRESIPSVDDLQEEATHLEIEKQSAIETPWMRTGHKKSTSALT